MARLFVVLLLGFNLSLNIGLAQNNVFSSVGGAYGFYQTCNGKGTRLAIHAFEGNQNQYQVNISHGFSSPNGDRLTMYISISNYSGFKNWLNRIKQKNHEWMDVAIENSVYTIKKEIPIYYEVSEIYCIPLFASSYNKKLKAYFELNNKAHLCTIEVFGYINLPGTIDKWYFWIDDFDNLIKEIDNTIKKARESDVKNKSIDALFQ